MKFKSVVSAAAIAVATTVGSASADERFATLDGIEAEPMSTSALRAVTGKLISIEFLPPNPIVPDLRINNVSISIVREGDLLEIQALAPTHFFPDVDVACAGPQTP